MKLSKELLEQLSKEFVIRIEEEAAEYSNITPVDIFEFADGLISTVVGHFENLKDDYEYNKEHK